MSRHATGRIEKQLRRGAARSAAPEAPAPVRHIAPDDFTHATTTKPGRTRIDGGDLPVRGELAG